MGYCKSYFRNRFNISHHLFFYHLSSQMSMNLMRTEVCYGGYLHVTIDNQRLSQVARTMYAKSNLAVKSSRLHHEGATAPRTPATTIQNRGEDRTGLICHTRRRTGGGARMVLLARGVRVEEGLIILMVAVVLAQVVASRMVTQARVMTLAVQPVTAQTVEVPKVPGRSAKRAMNSARASK